jgi:glucan phosphorylase
MATGRIFPKPFETKAQCVFTTHTPVEAGHDRFSAQLMDYALQRFRTGTAVPFPEVMALGRVKPDDANEPFCMTVLALRMSRAANGVSELHGRVSRHMWQCLYPDLPVEKVPIGHITNGIHLLGWMKGTACVWRESATRPASLRYRRRDDAFLAGQTHQVQLASLWAKIRSEFVSDESFGHCVTTATRID